MKDGCPVDGCIKVDGDAFDPVNEELTHFF
jgi:hypothetical protein